jgi:DNA end-binding protein Ku
MAEETFAVLREAMRKAGKAAIARVVLASRERVVAVGVRGHGMLLQTLRQPQEVRSDAEYFADISADGADKEMLALAERLIEQKAGAFKPGSYQDRYEEALREVIRAKVAGEQPVMAAAPERGKVINLMDALKKSLAQEKPPAASKGRKAAAPKKAAPKTAAKRKSA